MSTAVPVTMAKIYFIKNKNRLCSMTCGIDTIFRIFKIKKKYLRSSYVGDPTPKINWVL